MIGQTVGHYRILERLGGGGMGVVYKAEDTALHRTVALKFLPSELTCDADAKQRFLIEARAAAKLDHPNICNIHEIAESDDGQTFIAMAHYEGESLASRIRRGPLPDEEAAKIAIEIARGLGAAHEAGIIHRDIKPANIMLTSKGEVKIVDFGVAKLAGVTMTRGKASPGTLAYMAPEQIRGEPVTPATDLWALGAVFYEMLTGTRPFRGDYEQAVAYTILNEPPASLDEALPERASSLDAVIAKALTKDPTKRYQSAREIIEGLETVSGMRDSVARPSKADVRQVALAVVLLVVIAFATGVWLLRGRAPDDPPAPSPSENASPSTLAFSGLVAEQVVVAPFDNRTGDASLDAVGAMAAEWTSDELSRIGIMAVPARYAREAPVAAAKEKDPAIALAEATGSGLVVAGEYYLTESTITIRTKVIDTRERKVLDVLEPAEGPRSNPTQVVVAASNRVRDALAVRLVGPEVIRSVVTLGQCAPPKYEAYLEIMQLHAAAQSGERDSYVAHAERALELDPDSVDVRYQYYAVLLNTGRPEAAAALQEVQKRRACLSPVGRLMLDVEVAWNNGHYEQALNFTREAVRLVPGDIIFRKDLANVLIVLGRAREAVDVLSPPAGWDRVLTPEMAFSGQYYFYCLTSSFEVLDEHQRQLTEARRCRSIFTDGGYCREMEARALAALGRFQDLDQVITEASSQPLSLGSSWAVASEAAKSLRAHGHRERAIATAHRAISLFREQPPERQIQWHLANLLYLSGQLAEAETLYAKLVSETDNDRFKVIWLGRMGVIAAAKGDRAKALESESAMEGLPASPQLGLATYRRAQIHAQLAEKEIAMELLRQAFAEGWPASPDYYQLTLAEDPAFEALRGYLPFEELLKPKE